MIDLMIVTFLAWQTGLFVTATLAVHFFLALICSPLNLRQGELEAVREEIRISSESFVPAIEKPRTARIFGTVPRKPEYKQSLIRQRDSQKNVFPTKKPRNFSRHS